VRAPFDTHQQHRSVGVYAGYSIDRCVSPHVLTLFGFVSNAEFPPALRLSMRGRKGAYLVRSLAAVELRATGRRAIDPADGGRIVSLVIAGVRAHPLEGACRAANRRLLGLLSMVPWPGRL